MLLDISCILLRTLPVRQDSNTRIILHLELRKSFSSSNIPSRLLRLLPCISCISCTPRRLHTTTQRCKEGVNHLVTQSSSLVGSGRSGRSVTDVELSVLPTSYSEEESEDILMKRRTN